MYSATTTSPYLIRDDREFVSFLQLCINIGSLCSLLYVGLYQLTQSMCGLVGWSFTMRLAVLTRYQRVPDRQTDGRNAVFRCEWANTSDNTVLLIQLAPSFADVISRLMRVNVTSLRDSHVINNTASRCAVTSSYHVTPITSSLIV